MSHGHTEAQRYPLGMVYDEANLVTERINTKIITEAELIKLAVLGILSKSARKQFSKLIKQINVVVKPISGLFD